MTKIEKLNKLRSLGIEYLMNDYEMQALEKKFSKEELIKQRKNWFHNRDIIHKQLDAIDKDTNTVILTRDEDDIKAVEERAYGRV